MPAESEQERRKEAAAARSPEMDLRDLVHHRDLRRGGSPGTEKRKEAGHGEVPDAGHRHGETFPRWFLLRYEGKGKGEGERERERERKCFGENRERERERERVRGEKERGALVGVVEG